MSAYQVDPNHIGAILRWYLFDGTRDQRPFRGERPTTRDAAALATLLSTECFLSVSHRYPAPLPGPNAFPDGPVDVDTRNLGVYLQLTPIACIKAVHGLAYQSCEHPGWATSEACALLDDIKDAAVRKIAGYDDADWHITERAPNVSHSITDMMTAPRRRSGGAK